MMSDIDPMEYAALLYSDAVLTGEVNRLVAENHQLRMELETAIAALKEVSALYQPEEVSSFALSMGGPDTHSPGRKEAAAIANRALKKLNKS